MDTIKTWLQNNGQRWCLSLLRTFVSTFIGTLVFMLNSTQSFDTEIIRTLLISSFVAGISAVLKAILEFINPQQYGTVQKSTTSDSNISGKEGDV